MLTYVLAKSRMSVQTIAKISTLGALAFLIMMSETLLPFTPDSYKFGLDEVIVLIGGFALNPWTVACIEVLKTALNPLIGGTTTMGVGELINFLTGLSFVLPAVIIYQRDKTREHALLGLIAGTIRMTTLGGLLNYFVMLLAYSYLMNPPLNRIIEFGHAVNLNISGLLAPVLMATTPFNVLKGALCDIVVLLSYKKVSSVIEKQ